MKTRNQLRGAAGALVLAIAVAACGGSESKVKTIEGPTKSYESHGTVKKIDEQNNRITLDHEQIGDWMEPMTMPFPVSDPALLEGVEMNRRYAFTVVVGGADGEEYMITKLSPAQ